jgi:hypothetical protein
MKQKYSRLFGAMAMATLIAFAAAGCSIKATVGDDNNNNSTATTPPAKNATYSYLTNDQDDDGFQNGDITTKPEWVVATDLTIDGKTNVYGIYNARDTAYYHYESNGDISVNVMANILSYVSSSWRNFPLTKRWITLPLQSKATTRDTLVKIQNYVVGSIGIPLTVTTESVHQGTSHALVGSESLATQEVATTITVDIGSSRNKVLVVYTLAPTIGYFSQIDLRSSPSMVSSGVKSGGYLKRLDSYSK